MKIVAATFNIRCDTPADGENRWERRREFVFDLLRTQQADVLGLQEVLPHQFDEIRQALPEYGAVGVGRDDGRAAGEHCPVLYRQDRFRAARSGTFWFSDTPETPGSTGWGNRIPRICTWVRLTKSASGEAFSIYNVHLDHESQPARERSARLLIERVRQRPSADPVIVTGDFNVGEDDPVIALLTAEDSPVRVEAFRACQPRAEGVGTYHGYTGSTTGAKIDYLFVSPEWQTLDAQILHTQKAGRYPSDHFPVVAVLRSRNG